jgi:hypothetical protein
MTAPEPSTLARSLSNIPYTARQRATSKCARTPATEPQVASPNRSSMSLQPTAGHPALIQIP